MGEPAGGRARPSGDGDARGPAEDQLDDVARIVEAVRDVVQARAAMISRVVDDAWLEVVAVAGAVPGRELAGARWRRSDLDRLLESATQLGRLHATRRHALSYVEVPTGDRTGVPGESGLLVAPLRTAGGELLGVLATEGSADLVDPAPAVCQLVELYAGQARLALAAMRDQETVQDLRELDRYRRDLFASITHDLKTPLTAIALNTELLESDLDSGDAGDHPVAAIRRSTERLGRLVDDLLAMARAEEGLGVVADADLVEVVRDACRHAEPEARRRRVGFELDAPAQLRAPVDAGALARVFTNLVGNAVKFSQPGGHVLIRLRGSRDVIEFRCTDHGPGIAPDRLATLFDIPLRSPETRVQEAPGSGIGLAISHRIVTRLGGEITVESTPGQGSTFTVRVPIADPSEVDADRA